jgi:hypothetical protein
VKDVEMSVDNAHLRLEKVEDRVDGMVSSIRSVFPVCLQRSVTGLGDPTCPRRESDAVGRLLQEVRADERDPG